MEPQRSEDHTQTAWMIDPKHTSLQFSIKNLFFFTVKGSFTGLSGAIVLDETEHHHSSVTATIKAASIDTGKKRRDDHLRSADFLDVARYPDIGFQSTRVEKG